MPQAESHDVAHIGGEVFASMAEPSDKAVFMGELFMEKERLFFRKELSTEIASFSIKDTFQIIVRCLWQPAARTKSGHRPGPTIAMFHSLEFPLTTSWTWIKLARPLYKSGFSVVMIDMPGFGRSKMNMDPSVKLEDWQHQDWHIICQTLDELRIHSCLTLTIGEMCGTVLRILTRSPHSLGKEHIFLDPRIDPAEALGDLAGAPPPGAGTNWRAIMRLRYRDAMEKVLRNSKARIWSMHDKQKMTRQVFDTQCLLADARQHPVVAMRSVITEISKNDLCCCHIGANLPFSFLYPRKELVAEIVEYFIRREKGQEVVVHMPNYISADPSNSTDCWNPEMSPQFVSTAHHADCKDSKSDDLDQENPLRAIMRKSKEQERLKSEAALLGTPLKPQFNSHEAGSYAVPEKGTLARARFREGPENAKHIQWMDYSQTKHKVRQIISRSQCSMFTSAEDAHKLTGGAESAQGFRVGLLSKLSPTQRNFVAEHQSIEEKEEEDEQEEEEEDPFGFSKSSKNRPSSSGFTGISATKMAAVLARTRGGQKKTVADVRPASSPASSGNSRMQSALALVSARSPARSPPMSASTSRRPSFLAIEEKKSEGATLIMSKARSLPDVGTKGSMRSKSHLSIMEGSSSAGDQLEPRSAEGSRISSNLSTGGRARNKRSRSIISVTVVEPSEEGEKAASSGQ
eukprot:TRINITY_DN63350_c0_g1_i1.p1 TRINITY_DN63350_c0_g1~~TRINITY_DN63350_c0_g1_i1.p1  ORF type:complete len:687 (+),score=109.15 TRINITY_DN63350_c0_g1_i1:222-2282(+)